MIVARRPKIRLGQKDQGAGGKGPRPDGRKGPGNWRAPRAVGNVDKDKTKC